MGEQDKNQAQGNNVQPEKQEKNKDLIKNMKNKRVRKYALIALVCAIAVATVVGLSIENRDAKIEDGQGNLVIGTGEDVYDKADAEADGSDEASDSDEDKSAEEDKGAGKSDKSDKDKKDNNKQTAADLKFTEEEKDKLSSEDIKVDNTDDPTASNAGNVALKPKNPEPVTVTLEIRCDTISNNMDRLENPAIEDYIPENGVILEKTTYKGTTDNTVFDALNTLCRNNDIQLEFNYTPIYAAYYIEGINYLYEFDGGPQSGWMYKVNDWFPNYGCSSYYLKDGDTIVWCYTCEGLGTDVGAEEWMGYQ